MGARSVGIVTAVERARIIVVADDVYAGVLDTDAAHTNTIDPVIGALRPIRVTRRVVTEAVHIIAFSAAARLVVAPNVFAEILPADSVDADAI
jgi:hypothetical protein